MAAARWWRERRFRDEVRERHDAVERSRTKLLPLEETSSAMPSSAAGDAAGDVSSSGSAVERVSVATTDGVTDTRSTSEGRAA
jgi:hypothetical protein